MLTTSEEVQQGDRDDKVDNFVKKMYRSGYGTEEIVNITKAGLIGYERKLQRAKKDNKGVHRLARESLGTRYSKKLLSKTNWYKSKKQGEKSKGNCSAKNQKVKPEDKIENEPIAVLFVPRTRNGELVTLLREKELLMHQITK